MIRSPMMIYAVPIEKVHKYVVYFIRINFLITILVSLFQDERLLLLISFIGLLSTAAPSLFKQKYNVSIPIELEFFTILFIYASLFLGEVRGYYTVFWWWDIILHAGSAIALGFIGFIIMYTLDKGGRIATSPFLMAVFAFCFAVAIGTVWEIFEFFMDQVFGFNMQKSGLIDTMWDLIVDSLGALLASTIGYFYVRGKRLQVFSRIIERFVKENPQLFTR